MKYAGAELEFWLVGRGRSLIYRQIYEVRFTDKNLKLMTEVTIYRIEFVSQRKGEGAEF